MTIRDLAVTLRFGISARGRSTSLAIPVASSGSTPPPAQISNGSTAIEFSGIGGPAGSLARSSVGAMCTMCHVVATRTVTASVPSTPRIQRSTRCSEVSGS